MRIGMLTTSYPRFANDLAGNFVAQMAHWFAQQEDSLDVIAPVPAVSTHQAIKMHALNYAFCPRLFYGAGAPDNLLASSLLVRIATWYQVPTFVSRLATSCIRLSKHWDGIISHWLLPCSLVAATCARLPHLAIAHSSDVHLLTKLPFASAALHALARQKTKLVMTSESLRLHLLPLCKSEHSHTLVSQAEIIRMGISPPAFASQNQIALLRQQFALKDKTIVLFVGRLVPVKGVDVLIKACAKLSDISVVIVGDGPQKSNLQELSKQLGCSAIFVGEKYGNEKWLWLQAADFFVLPSLILKDGRTDSAPVALLEAMAMGLPTITSDTGGARELIFHNENGLLIPSGNATLLRNAILQLTRDRDLCAKLRINAQKTASQYDWDIVGARMRGLLLGLMPDGN